jgi:hypothetical protein
MRYSFISKATPSVQTQNIRKILEEIHWRRKTQRQVGYRMTNCFYFLFWVNPLTIVDYLTIRVTLMRTLMVTPGLRQRQVEQPMKLNETEREGK